MIGARWYSFFGLQQDYISASLLEGSGLVAWNNGSHRLFVSSVLVSMQILWPLGRFARATSSIDSRTLPGVNSFISRRVRETGACKSRHMGSFTQKYPAWKVILVTFYF